LRLRFKGRCWVLEFEIGWDFWFGLCDMLELDGLELYILIPRFGFFDGISNDSEIFRRCLFTSIRK
jgi:hypothetical protein